MAQSQTGSQLESLGINIQPESTEPVQEEDRQSGKLSDLGINISPDASETPQEPRRQQERFGPGPSPEEREEISQRASDVMGSLDREDRDTRMPTWVGNSLAFIDRPRAANAGYLIAAFNGASIQEAGKQWMAGIRGEQHPLMGDHIFELTQSARENPEDHPIMSSIQNVFGMSGVRMEEGKHRPSMSEMLFSPGMLHMTPLRLERYERDNAKVDAFISTVGGIGADIAIDPLTYSGVGLTTKGLTARAALAARGEGRSITDPQMLRRLEEMERRGDMMEWGETVTDRLFAGQERAWLAGVPLPAQVSGNMSKGGRFFTNQVKKIPLMTNIGRAFSTRFGLEGDLRKFGDLEERLMNVLTVGREGAILENAALSREVSQIARDISRDVGFRVPDDVVGQQLTRLVEDVKMSAAVKGLNYDDMLEGIRSSEQILNRSLGGIGRQYIKRENISYDMAATIGSHPQIQKMVQGLRTKNAQQLRDEISAGVKINELGSGNRQSLTKLEDALKANPVNGKLRNPLTGRMVSPSQLEKITSTMRRRVERQEDLDYFVHALTPEAKRHHNAKAFTSGKSSGFQYNLNNLSAHQRKWENMSINEINDLARRGELPGYEGKKFRQGFFIDDPAVAQTIRDMRHNNNMEVARFMDDAIDQFGTPVGSYLSPEASVRYNQLQDTISRAQADGLDTVINPLTGREATPDTLRELMNREIRENIDVPAGYAVSSNPLTRGYVFPEEVVHRLDGHYEALMNPENVNMFLRGVDAATGWWKSWTLGIFPEYHFRNAMGNVWNNWVTGTTDMRVYGTATKIQQGRSGSVRTMQGEDIPFETIRDQMESLGIKNRGFIGTDLTLTLKNEIGKGRWATLSRENQGLYYANRYGRAIENNARIAKFIDEVQKGASFDEAARLTKRALFDYSDLTRFEQNTMKRLFPFYTWSRKNIPLQVEQMMRTPGRYKAMDTLIQNIEANVEDPGEYSMARWMLDSYPMRVRIDPEDGMPRYFLFGNWAPFADVVRIGNDMERMLKGEGGSRVMLDLLNPLFKTPAELAFNYDTFTNQTIRNYEGERVPFMGDSVRLPPQLRHVMRNIRVLTTLDDMLPDEYRGLMPQTVRDYTPEENLLKFLTGIRLYGVDFQQQSMMQAREEEQEAQQMFNRMANEIRLSNEARNTLQRYYSEEQVVRLQERLADSSIEMINHLRRYPMPESERRQMIERIVNEDREERVRLRDLMRKPAREQENPFNLEELLND